MPSASPRPRVPPVGDGPRVASRPAPLAAPSGVPRPTSDFPRIFRDSARGPTPRPRGVGRSPFPFRQQAPASIRLDSSWKSPRASHGDEATPDLPPHDILPAHGKSRRLASLRRLTLPPLRWPGRPPSTPRDDRFPIPFDSSAAGGARRIVAPSGDSVVSRLPAVSNEGVGSLRPEVSRPATQASDGDGRPARKKFNVIAIVC